MFEMIATRCVQPKEVEWIKPNAVNLKVNEDDSFVRYDLLKGAQDYLHKMVELKPSTSIEVFKKSDFSPFCNKTESLTFLSKVFVQILCRSQEIDLNLVALGDAKEIFAIFISVVEVITDHSKAVEGDCREHGNQILLIIASLHQLFFIILGQSLAVFAHPSRLVNGNAHCCNHTHKCCF